MTGSGTTVRLRHGSKELRAASIVAAFAVVAFAGSVGSARADEGGVSFWVPGFFGSLAATPQQPGFSLATIYYHTSVSADGNIVFARQVSAGNLKTNFTGNLNASLKADADLGMAIPTYTFRESLLGGQAAVALLVPFGNTSATANATLMGNLGLGGPGFTVGGSRTDDALGFGDLMPYFSLKWNSGVNSYMTYVTGNLTTGVYDQNSLANLGLGHNAIDAGGGYTYFDPKTGYEFSGVLGFTYNFENDHTQYQNGIDAHFDWGASRFLTKQLQIGLVGYVYDQLSCDSGAGNRVGCFESRVLGVGPQIGYVFPLDKNLQGYLNLKAYGEFDNANRPDGWNVWVTFAISPAPPAAVTPSHLITK